MFPAYLWNYMFFKRQNKYKPLNTVTLRYTVQYQRHILPFPTWGSQRASTPLVLNKALLLISNILLPFEDTCFLQHMQCYTIKPHVSMWPQPTARAFNSVCTMSSANTSSHLIARMSNTRKNCCLYMQPNDRQLSTLNESCGSKAFEDKYGLRPHCLIFKVRSFWN